MDHNSDPYDVLNELTEFLFQIAERKSHNANACRIGRLIGDCDDIIELKIAYMDESKLFYEKAIELHNWLKAGGNRGGE